MTKTNVSGTLDQAAGFVIVALTMVEMFTVPRQYFVLGSIVSTSSMICASYLLTKNVRLFNWAPWRLALGIAFALLLYLIFYLGNFAIQNFNVLGMGSSNELTIYGLFANAQTPVLIVVFLFDAVGFESYFRGNLQRKFATRLGIGSVFVVAMMDALIHLSTFNPLFPATTFVADSIWGLNYYFTRDLYSTIICHFLWDIMIFILLPIH